LALENFEKDIGFKYIKRMNRESYI
jgi:hypothetical protein